jgi:TPR repeat protein
MRLLTPNERVSDWLLPLAQQGDLVAQAQFGTIHVLGSEHASNLPEGIKWLTRAANGNLIEAQVMLSVTYARIVPERNIEQARYWAKRAASQGDDIALQLLTELDAAPNPPDMPIIEPTHK